MFAVVPIQVDVPMERWPYANFALIGVTCAVTFMAWTGLLSKPTVDAMVLNGWSPIGLLGYLFLHGGPMHLLGNMIFLWVFGNAVCAKLGGIGYLGTYLGLGVIAGAVSNILLGMPTIGASGAINGIVGMYLIWYPLNDVNCWWWFFIRAGFFAVSSAVMIVIWFALDVWGAFSGGSAVAYGAHLGGFLGGFALAAYLLRSGRVPEGAQERSLFTVMGWK